MRQNYLLHFFGADPNIETFHLNLGVGMKRDKEIKTEKEKSKKKKKVNLIRLKDRDLKNVQTGIPAFNRYFKENHMKVNNLKNNRDKISKSQPSH